MQCTIWMKMIMKHILAKGLAAATICIKRSRVPT